MIERQAKCYRVESELSHSEDVNARHRRANEQRYWFKDSVPERALLRSFLEYMSILRDKSAGEWQDCINLVKWKHEVL